MVKHASPLSKLIWLALALLVSGCATPSAPPPVAPERIPSLPAQGRASLVPIPSECLPSCSSGLTRERNEWANTLTGSPLPARPANATPTDYSLPTGKKLR